MDMNGNGGSDGSWVIILFMAILFGGFGGCGIGGRGGCDSGEYGRAEHQHMDTREEIRFNEAATQSSIGELSTDLWQRTIYGEVCDTNRNIDQNSAIINANIAANSKENAILLKDMALDNFKCCCETQKAIAASQTAILSRIDAFENQNLRDKVGELQLGLSQCNQNQALIQAIRPCPVPAYNTCNPWSGAAYNGGCNTGCGF